jgi:hypothetical protein
VVHAPSHVSITAIAILVRLHLRSVEEFGKINLHDGTSDAEAIDKFNKASKPRWACCKGLFCKEPGVVTSVCYPKTTA